MMKQPAVGDVCVHEWMRAASYEYCPRCQATCGRDKNGRIEWFEREVNRFITPPAPRPVRPCQPILS